MIKKIKPKSPDPYLSKTVGDNALARIAHVNQLVDQINKSVPYKVYTALLTQSGTGYDPNDQDAGQLTIGKTYYINNLSVGMDFTNVGAPNNDVGTYFVATGPIPNNWGANEGGGGIPTLIYDNSAPVVTVLENTIGNIWFTYSGIGTYYIGSNALFSNIDKCYITVPSMMNSGDDTIFAGNRVQFTNNSNIQLETFNIEVGGTITRMNYNLYNTPIEIRVYN